MTQACSFGPCAICRVCQSLPARTDPRGQHVGYTQANKNLEPGQLKARDIGLQESAALNFESSRSQGWPLVPSRGQALAQAPLPSGARMVPFNLHPRGVQVWLNLTAQPPRSAKHSSLGIQRLMDRGLSFQWEVGGGSFQKTTGQDPAVLPVLKTHLSRKATIPPHQVAHDLALLPHTRLPTYIHPCYRPHCPGYPQLVAGLRPSHLTSRQKASHSCRHIRSSPGKPRRSFLSSSSSSSSSFTGSPFCLQLNPDARKYLGCMAQVKTHGQGENSSLLQLHYYLPWNGKRESSEPRASCYAAGIQLRVARDYGHTPLPGQLGKGQKVLHAPHLQAPLPKTLGISEPSPGPDLDPASCVT